MFDQMNGFNPRQGKFLWLTGDTVNSANNSQSWTIPRNTSWIFAILISGGGSGGGGQSNGGGTAGGGGAGGATGGITRILAPATFLPKTLYLSAGTGGAGVPAATAGNPGAFSFISAVPIASGATAIGNSFANIIAISNGTSFAPGGGAAGALNATGGAVGSSTSSFNQVLSSVAIWKNIVGQAGTASGASGAAGVSAIFGVSEPYTGGTGGGSTDTATGSFAGGAIAGAGLVPNIPGGLAGGGNGQNGYRGTLTGGGSFASLAGQCFLNTGGTGGGSNANGNGGNGGVGGYGCGGGGGGGAGGTVGGTGGAGGAGGPGLIFLAWW
jgi:hypothetical protein